MSSMVLILKLPVLMVLLLLVVVVASTTMSRPESVERHRCMPSHESMETNRMEVFHWHSDDIVVVTVAEMVAAATDGVVVSFCFR